MISLLDVPEGSHKFDTPVYIKNNTDKTIKLKCKLVKSVDYVICSFYPGWNPEEIVELVDVPANSLQKGY